MVDRRQRGPDSASGQCARVADRSPRWRSAGSARRAERADPLAHRAVLVPDRLRLFAQSRSAAARPFHRRSARRSMRVRAQRRLTAVGRVRRSATRASRGSSIASPLPTSLRDRHPHGRRDPDERRAADPERRIASATASTVSQLEVALLFRQSRLIEKTDPRPEGRRMEMGVGSVAWRQDTLYPTFPPDAIDMAYSHSPFRAHRRGRDRHHQPSRQAQCAERDRHRRAGRRGRPDRADARHRGAILTGAGTEGVRRGRGHRRDRGAGPGGREGALARRTAGLPRVWSGAASR